VPLERTPRVKVVPEVVEALDLLLGSVRSAKLGNGEDVGETALADKDGRVRLAVLVGSNLLGVGNVVGNVPVGRVELAALLGVGEVLVGLGLVLFGTVKTHPSGCT
jgi:hypothetical protein